MPGSEDADMVDGSKRAAEEVNLQYGVAIRVLLTFPLPLVSSLFLLSSGSGRGAR
jgi:hypothetical protein